ncbi:hypothetical protein Syun_016287 [Stephania yunnanensis]|uniref:Uncharacterized protein n=1 Tax=Stephania yunnanensis TaxID=152371 RepID=A0AAP0J5N9_9MAGN
MSLSQYRAATQCITIQTGESWTAGGRGRTGGAAVATGERETARERRERQIRDGGIRREMAAGEQRRGERETASWWRRRIVLEGEADGGDGEMEQMVRPRRERRW